MFKYSKRLEVHVAKTSGKSNGMRAVCKLSWMKIWMRSRPVCWTKIIIIYNLRNVYQTKDIQTWSEKLISVRCKFELWRRVLIVHLHMTVVNLLRKTLIAMWQTLCPRYSWQELYQRSLAVAVFASVRAGYLVVIAGQFQSQGQKIS